jgi:hypothetical protein
LTTDPRCVIIGLPNERGTDTDGEN